MGTFGTSRAHVRCNLKNGVEWYLFENTNLAWLGKDHKEKKLKHLTPLHRQLFILKSILHFFNERILHLILFKVDYDF